MFCTILWIWLLRSKKNFQVYCIYLLIILSVEPSAQSKAKIALSKADKAVGWTVSAAYRFTQDMMRRIGQKNSSFYTAGQNSFTDGLIIVALLLAFVLVFILGYCAGSRICRRRQVVSVAPTTVTQTSMGRVGDANGDTNDDGDRQVNDGDDAQRAIVW